jgi:hypothetical protein
MKTATIERCRDKLIEVARNRETITYGALAAYLGLGRPNTDWRVWFTTIDRREIGEGRPDLTLVVVRKDTKLGRLGTPENLIPVTAENVGEYRRKLAEVYECWGK